MLMDFKRHPYTKAQQGQESASRLGYNAPPQAPAPPPPSNTYIPPAMHTGTHACDVVATFWLKHGVKLVLISCLCS